MSHVRILATIAIRRWTSISSGKRRVIFLREKLLCGTPSNACTRVGGQQHAIDRQTAGSHGRIGEVTGVIMDARPRPILRTLRQPRLHRVQVNQEEAVFLAAFVDNPAQQANSAAVRIPRQGKTRTVIKNQSDTTKRRSRDIAPSIFLKPVTATRHFSMSSIPHGVPQSNFSRRKITLRYAATPLLNLARAKIAGDVNVRALLQAGREFGELTEACDAMPVGMGLPGGLLVKFSRGCGNETVSVT